jgi:SulP family sulfate permease
MNFVNGLHFNNIRGDIYGGVTAAVVALPLALAMGVTSGAGPIAGIYGAIFVGFFAALFGGTPAQVSGPTGPMTVVMALIFTQFTTLYPDDPATSAALAFTVVIMGGLFQILFGLLRIGKFIELVPHPVVSGFMSGIGVIIILLQIGPLMGYDSPAKPLNATRAAPEFITNPHGAALTLALVALAIVFIIPTYFPKVNRMMPAPLMALIVGTCIYMLFMQDTDAPILGDIPTGLPDPQLPTIMLKHLPDMITSALMLAALGAIDSLLTSLVADNITRTHHLSDRELIGQGIGNTIAGLFGGLPGAGATMRTVVNVKAGGQTPISGTLHAVILLVIVLGAGGLAANIPKAVLAGILVKVGVDIIDWDYLKRIKTLPKTGIILMLTVLLLTVFVDLIIAVSVGMVMASMIFLKRMTDLQLKSITVVNQPNEEAPLTEHEKAILQEAQGRILLYHIEGPLSFGAAKGMVRRLANFKQFDALVIDLTDVPVMDFTSVRALDDMISDTLAVNRKVFLVCMRPKLKTYLDKQGIFKKLELDSVHSQRSTALCAAARSIDLDPELCKPTESN